MPVEQRRDTLVQAALEIAIEDGVGAVTTRNVCARANAHLSVFHYCFSGKGELVDMMVREISSRLNASFDLSRAQTLPDFIRHSSELLADEWSLAFTLYELVVASARVEHDEGKEPRHFSSLTDAIELLVAGYAEQSGFRWAVDQRTVAQLIVTFLAGTGVGWISDHVGKPPTADQVATVDTFVQLIDGLQIRD